MGYSRCRPCVRASGCDLPAVAGSFSHPVAFRPERIAQPQEHRTSHTADASLRCLRGAGAPSVLRRSICDALIDSFGQQPCCVVAGGSAPGARQASVVRRRLGLPGRWLRGFLDLLIIRAPLQRHSCGDDLGFGSSEGAEKPASHSPRESALRQAADAPETWYHHHCRRSRHSPRLRHSSS